MAAGDIDAPGARPRVQQPQRRTHCKRPAPPWNAGRPRQLLTTVSPQSHQGDLQKPAGSCRMANFLTTAAPDRHLLGSAEFDGYRPVLSKDLPLWSWSRASFATKRAPADAVAGGCPCAFRLSTLRDGCCCAVAGVMAVPCAISWATRPKTAGSSTRAGNPWACAVRSANSSGVTGRPLAVPYERRRGLSPMQGGSAAGCQSRGVSRRVDASLYGGDPAGRVRAAR